MQKTQRITLNDVAERVGVTKMTVSRYLKNPQTVAKDTGLKIKAVIDELGFVPSRAPVLLSQSASRTIGLAVSSFSNLLFSDVIHGVETRAREYGYEILITHTSYLEEEEERRISQLLSYQVDALILTDSQHTPATIKRLKSAKVPVVELMSLLPNALDMNIGYDHVKISYTVIKGLIQSGRKNIAYLRARLDARTLDRQHGYLLACRDGGITPYIFGSNVRSDFSRGADMMRKALVELKDVDAVFCTNDDVAIGAMIACTEMGIAVPDQVSVIGYNGLNIGTTTIPRLTSIVTARQEMGRMAVDMIIKRLRGIEINEPCVELYPQLSLGQSLRNEEHVLISRMLDTLYAAKTLPPKPAFSNNSDIHFFADE